MKKLFVAALVAAFVVLLPVSSLANLRPQDRPGEYLDLTKDQFVPGGLTGEGISKELLPAFAGYAPKERSEEVIKFAFNYDIPKLQLAFRNAKTGKIDTRTGKLAKGEELVATINRKELRGGVWYVNATVRWAQHCGNPIPIPFEVDLEIPDWSQDRVYIQKITIAVGYAVTVVADKIVQQLVPSLRDIEIHVPEAKPGSYTLVVLGREEAGRRWVYEKNFWDHFLDFLRVVAEPIGQIFRRADNIEITTHANGYGAAAAAAAASSSSSSTAVTPTSGAGTSGSGGAGAGGAAGGGEPEWPSVELMPGVTLYFERSWLQDAA